MMKQLMLRILVVISLTNIASCQEVRQVKITVTEEDKSPVEGAQVTVDFLGYQGSEDKELKGLSDNDGVYSTSGSASLDIQARVSKEGYYETRLPRLGRTTDHDITCVLRKKIKPIALYAKKYKGKLPSLDQSYGFDFEVGDWVAPHGKGSVIDVYLKANIVEMEGALAGKLSMTFSNENEGLVEVNKQNGYLNYSKLMMPNEALTEGYANENNRIESGYQNLSKNLNTSFFFRTRIQKVPNGDDIYNYSKFKDSYNFTMGGGRFLEEPYRSKYPIEYGMIEFTYYYNPTPNDRNLEFDPTKNLFRKLSSSEKVREP